MKHTLFSKKPILGFTIVELLVATTILSLLVAATVQRFGQTRAVARDGQRKSSARVIEQALETSHITNGTYLVTLQGKVCTLLTAGTTTSAQVRTGDGCTGANGAGMGLANLASVPGGAVTFLGPIHGTAYTYSQVSINYALRQNGYLTKEARDPQSTSTTDPNSPDFSILTFCPGGLQKDGGDGAFAAVFTSLEGTPTASDLTITANNGGGKNAVPSTDYALDFAAPSTQLNRNVFSVGTGNPRSGQAQGKRCSDVALAR